MNRPLSILIAILAVGLVLFGFAPGVALAATAAGPSVTIDLAPLINGLVIPLLTSVLLALAGWAMTKVAAYAHIQIQASQRQLVDDAIAKAIAYAEQLLAGKEQVQASDKVAAAVNYLLPKIPDALKGLGVTPEHLGQMVTARLSPPTPGA